MTAPSPRTPLTGHCSVIHDDILYVFSSEAFQALPLKNNGTWSQLTGGVSVSGAACVQQTGTGTTEDALWVVGGRPRIPNAGYTGLQRYSFTSKRWQTIEPVDQVTKNRQSHAAVYLPGISSILVYSGSQDGDSIPTTETFLLSTVPPFSVRSYTAKNAPAIAPLLLQWDGQSAITLGGSPNNSNIYRFQQELGWLRIRPALTGRLKPSPSQQATLITGSDNSKVLQLYDLSVNPSNVTQVLLQKVDGKPARPGRYVGQSPLGKRKRDLSLRDWPIYNATFAPTATRTDYGLARGSDGTVAISGGGDEDQSVALFNEDRNAWVNTTDFFGASANQKPLVPSRVSSLSPTSTSSSSPAALPGNGDHDRTETILGAVLGSILGFVALLIIILILMRWRRRKNAQKRQREMDEAEEEDDDEKDRMSFMDRGDPLTKEVGGFTYPASHHSLSIHEGKTGHDSAHRRSDTRGSEKSTTHLVPKQNEHYEMSPITGKIFKVPTPVPEAAQSTTSLQVPGAAQPIKRSSGWSGYFGDSRRNTPRSSVRAATPDGGGGQQAVGGSAAPSSHDRDSHSPTELPPLDMGQQFTGVHSHKEQGSADMRRVSSVRDSGERTRTMSSSFSRPSTAPSDWSHNEQEPANWTPVTGHGFSTPATRDTMTSSIYGSNAGGTAANDGSPAVAAQPTFSLAAPPASTGSHVLPKTVAEEEEDPHVAAKVIAVRVEQAPVKQPESAAVQSDMSWLNLGAVK